MAQQPGGHNISREFSSESSDGRTPTTSTTPSTPSGRKNAFRSGQQAATSRSTSAQARVDRNLELAYEGDDSALLPYRPTRTINPRRPRTLAAGYDAQNEILYVRFRDGAGYEYHNVSRSQWRQFKTTPSPGRYINAELNRHPYSPADW